jgi:sigma-B regulation protein RsbU (phosphoserine phosphatase)
MTFTMPEKVRPENHRFFNITQAAYIFGATGHFAIGIFFWWLNVWEMVVFNFVFSVPVFCLSFYLNRRARHDLAFSIAFIELLFHQVAGIFYTGWAGGFQYWFIYLAALAFFNAHWKGKIRIFYITVVTVTFTVMYLFYRSFGVYSLSQTLYGLMYLSNSLMTLLSMALLINYYVRAAQRAESDLRSVNLELSEKNTQIEQALTERNQVLEQLNKELNEAAEYIRTILPQPINAGPVRTDWRFVPSTSLGGDAFGYHWLDKDHFVMYLIDVSGHGVGAALLSVSVMNALRSQSLPDTDFKDPSNVLTALNTAFPGEENNDMFFTMWYGVYNKNSRELSYACAGHPPALLLNPPNLEKLRTPNYVVGGMLDIRYQKDNIRIDEGSSLYIFSDGVFEIRKPDGAMWKFDEFTETIGQYKAEGVSMLDGLLKHALEMGGSDTFADDFTMVEVVLH